ncbi:unnamed protein product [Bubo scandiacus]
MRLQVAAQAPRRLRTPGPQLPQVRLTGNGTGGLPGCRLSSAEEAALGMIDNLYCVFPKFIGKKVFLYSILLNF